MRWGERTSSFGTVRARSSHSHASVVPRRLEVSGDVLSAGYVEAVATDPRFQRKGLATAVMRAVAAFIEGRYRMGALSSSIAFLAGGGHGARAGRGVRLMDAVAFLLPVAIGLDVVFLILFIVAARQGQFDDLDDPPRRILKDD